MKFTPFCRPTEAATFAMAQLFYSVPAEQQIEAMYAILRQVWTKGKDLSFKAHFDQMCRELNIQQRATEDVGLRLQKNDMYCEMKSQPSLPVLELRIAGQSYVFNSLYRVWMIESIFSNVLQELYKSENESENEQRKTQNTRTSSRSN